MFDGMNIVANWLAAFFGTGMALFGALMTYARVSVASNDAATQPWVLTIARIPIRSRSELFASPRPDEERAWAGPFVMMLLGAVMGTLGWIHVISH